MTAVSFLFLILLEQVFEKYDWNYYRLFLIHNEAKFLSIAGLRFIIFAK